VEPRQEALGPINPREVAPCLLSGDGGTYTFNGCPYVWGMVLERARAVSWAALLFDTLYGSVLLILIGSMSWEWGLVVWGTP
jgi:hypothetical protein